jgi:hypothetical protein
MEPVTSSPPVASPPDPPQYRAGITLPHNITVLLHAVSILLDYGRHLVDTVRHRAAAPNFNAIAVNFGTANLATILAHLNRGILRAAALERFLLARGATGRDFDLIDRHPRTPQPQPQTAPADTQAGQSATPPAARKPAPRPSSPADRDDTELFNPSLQDLERQVRRRPIGRTISDICSDLAVVPGLCTAPFWAALTEMMLCLGGSIATLMQEKTRRREAFIQEQNRQPGSNWDWLRLQRDAIRQVLGFFIGEPPVNPFALETATATGPP